eukprot:TRINITY_DN1327_c1_g1_i1.p3 TRINITY_DN1327_c1_g1~~TRINITY_DN1327_c1_g1_i1.p3  ORF type:complete len:247 (+),score=57.71 TRINITY_DN1327_c1_g1_i1:155-895(+)
MAQAEKVVGPVKLETFKARTEKEALDVATLVSYKLMRYASHSSFNQWFLHFIGNVVGQLPSQEIGKLIKEVAKIIAAREAADKTVMTVGPSKAPKVKKTRGTLAYERDDISGALAAMYDDDDGDEEEAAAERARKRTLAAAAAAAAQTKTQSLADFDRSAAGTTTLRMAPAAPVAAPVSLQPVQAVAPKEGKGKGGKKGKKGVDDDDDFLNPDPEAAQHAAERAKALAAERVKAAAARKKAAAPPA